MRGRKPTPTLVKKLRGNPGRRPLPENEPQLPAPDAAAFDAPPPELADDLVAQREWSRLAPELRKARVVTDADRGALIAVCQQWSRYQDANKRVAEDGMVIRSQSGYPMPNPYIGIANKSLQNCVKLWVELGLTPSARSRVKEAPGPTTGDPFTEFFDESSGERRDAH